MKKNLLLAALLLVIINTQAQEHICKEVNGIAQYEAVAQSKKITGAQLTLASSNFSVNYYRCEWTIDPAVNYISGKVTSYFTVSTASNALVFDLYHGLKVDSIFIRKQKLVFSQSSNETLTIQLPKTYKAGKKDSLSIYYQGVPLGSGFGSYVQTTHNETPVIWTLSEPYGARDWWPCRNGLDDKADSMDIYVTHPSQYKTSANGVLVNTLIKAGNITTHYKHRYPIASYLVAFSVTNFSTFTDYVQLGNASLPVISYIYPEDSAVFHNDTYHMLDAMQLYNEKFTAYPFISERYGQTQFAWGGGMEHQTNSFITNSGENLMAHELAHQWFGDKITCGSWQDVWLNEGFATFCADFLYTEKFDKPQNKANVKSDLAYIVSKPGGSVKVNDTTSVSRIFDGRLSYDKGAFLLRMLRWTLGDSLFFKGIRNYLDDPALKYNFAFTIDLQRNLEAVSGIDLDYFFNQWYTGQGYPTFTVQWSQDASNIANINISQVTSHTSVSFFKVPLALKFRNSNQEKTIIVQHNFNHQVITADIGFKADTVFIDPDAYLISKNNKAIHIAAAKTTFTEPVTVSPNPFKNNVAITLKETDGKKVLIQLYDNYGRLVTSNTFITENKNQKYTLSVPSSSPNGIYQLRITVDGRLTTRNVIKQ